MTLPRFPTVTAWSFGTTRVRVVQFRSSIFAIKMFQIFPLSRLRTAFCVFPEIGIADNQLKGLSDTNIVQLCCRVPPAWVLSGLLFPFHNMVDS